MIDADRIRAHLDGLTKPPGSLGRLERLAADLCRVQGTLAPRSRPRRLVVFAGDHGVVASGVSAWPSEVTGLMVRNIAAGGAACCALARSGGTELRLVDVGSTGPAVEPSEHVRVERVAEGTRDLFHGPAMTREEFERAVAVGRDEALAALADGARVLAAGEMGIGNTTPAACLAVALAGVPLEQAVGRGAGADDAVLARKREVVAAAVARERARTDDPLELGAALGGLELAAIAGFLAEGARGGAVLVLDGVIATAGALLARALDPACVGSMVAAHRSVEPAHDGMLASLGLEPYLDWDLRLGEGTGALLLMPLLDAAAAMCGEMATLADLLGGGVDGAPGAEPHAERASPDAVGSADAAPDGPLE